MNPETIERLIAQGQDRYEARLAAGQARLKRGDIAQAIAHLSKATELAPDKTMAWQVLGEAYRRRGQLDQARAAFEQGIEVARGNGDSQAEKVMAVWLKRLRKLPDLPDPQSVFAENRLLALPTETVYGLAAPIDRPDLIARVFELKERPADHPLIVHVGSVEQARSCVADWPSAAEALGDKFWPGPLTLVLPKADRISDAITAGQSTVALRMPDHPLALELLKRAEVPMVAPSANPFTHLSPTRAADVAQAFSSDEVAVVDGGPCQVGIESIIVALDSNNNMARVLRPGIISEQAISEALPADWKLADPSGASARAPGQLAAHYRPSSPLRVEVLNQQNALDDRFEALSASVDQTVIQLPAEAELAARDLYALLRTADSENTGELVILLLEDQRCDPAWAGIINRLEKAASTWANP